MGFEKVENRAVHCQYYLVFIYTLILINNKKHNIQYDIVFASVSLVLDAE